MSNPKRVDKDEQVKQAASRVAASPGPLRSFRIDQADQESRSPSSSQWVDGSEGRGDDYDEEDDDRRIRKLNKADRKRLRQQKRAA